ncbi:glycosyltransferase family 4 protein [Micromonospora sp. DT48]|uniref:glycosyltransferase family 4 protein n=1 Tax=unclassified Micromonospora TaxID=2617518 RepID=UPI0012BC8908|nr:glycosyltransferase family 4 protein [Micromonospora sp. CP22]MTK02900.1 glycosyltransferase family 4 protein [Micromonospora sp. CP22]
MKIVYLHQYFRTPQMSGGTRSFEFARRLVARGHEVHVVTSDTEPGDAPLGSWRVSTEVGATVHWAAVPYRGAMSYPDRIRAFFRFARVAATRAASLPQDVVFATSTPLTIAIPGAYSARRRRVPMVLEVRDVWPEVPVALGALRTPASRWAAHRLERWAYHRARHIIALSPGMAESIERRFPGLPVTVIPNGCDRSLFADADRFGTRLRAATPWLGDRHLVLYAGALGYLNRVEYVVRMAAAAWADKPDIRFAIIGQGPEREHVRSLAEQLGVLGRNLFLLDPLPKSEMASYFGACDLAISTVRDIPELHANSANKVFDGLAAGRPVAVNHEGWIADLIRENDCGVVLPAGDPALAARLVAGFLHDSERTARARRAAQRLAQTRFDRDVLFDQFEQILLDTARPVLPATRRPESAATPAKGR